MEYMIAMKDNKGEASAASDGRNAETERLNFEAMKTEYHAGG